MWSRVPPGTSLQSQQESKATFLPGITDNDNSAYLQVPSLVFFFFFQFMHMQAVYTFTHSYVVFTGH